MHLHSLNQFLFCQLMLFFASNNDREVCKFIFRESEWRKAWNETEVGNWKAHSRVQDNAHCYTYLSPRQVFSLNFHSINEKLLPRKMITFRDGLYSSQPLTIHPKIFTKGYRGVWKPHPIRGNPKWIAFERSELGRATQRVDFSCSVSFV